MVTGIEPRSPELKLQSEAYMQRVTRDRYSYVFDRNLPPVLRVQPGETFQIETEDSRTGQTRTPETISAEYVRSLRRRGPYYGNPVTGPIAIEGVQPGDAISVRIHDMECDTLGYFGYWPVLYHMQDWFQEPVTELVEIRDGHVLYNLKTPNGPHPIRVPVRPMIGCIGVAPHLEVPTAGTAGPFGGNLDVPEVCPGSTVTLGAAVRDGMLYLGDCHPYQGDGEVSGCEMRSVVTLSVEVHRGGLPNLVWPRIETATHLVTLGAGSPAEAAQWIALREMIGWLEARYGWSKRTARDFITLVGDLRPGQMQVSPFTMRFLVPKSQLPDATV